MSTTSATEAARQPNTEPDPANAGLGTTEAPLPTWGEALAHVKVLRAQGVKVRVDEGWMLIEIFGTDGELHDSDDGTPAYQDFYPDGTPKVVEHWTNGKRHDPDDGTPAYQEFYPDGTPERIGHYTNGELVSEENFPPPTGEA